MLLTVAFVQFMGMHVRGFANGAFRSDVVPRGLISTEDLPSSPHGYPSRNSLGSGTLGAG